MGKVSCGCEGGGTHLHDPAGLNRGVHPPTPPPGWGTPLPTEGRISLPGLKLWGIGHVLHHLSIHHV